MDMHTGRKCEGIEGIYHVKKVEIYKPRNGKVDSKTSKTKGETQN